MKIVVGKPPVYAEIMRVLGRPPFNAVYTWGETLYVHVSSSEPDPGLLAHEQTHSRQQAAAGGPERWWKRYLAEPEFRLAQELEAYRAQYKLWRAVLPRPGRRAVLKQLATDLSSAMYGRVIAKPEALRLIQAVGA